MSTSKALAPLNGTRVDALGRRRERRLTLVRANTARAARGSARLEFRTLRVLNSGAGVAQLASRWTSSTFTHRGLYESAWRPFRAYGG